MINLLSISSAVTLLAVAALNPVRLLSSSRLSGPWKNSLDSSTDRFRRLMSRTVVRFASTEGISSLVAEPDPKAS